MAFDNEYPNRKDWRRPYYRGGRASRGCRPHGSCPYCLASRTYSRRKAEARAAAALREAGFRPV